jgi:hypothetical protein
MGHKLKVLSAVQEEDSQRGRGLSGRTGEAHLHFLGGAE